MLGPLLRALVGVPAEMTGLLLDITNRFGGENGDVFYADLAKFVRDWRRAVANVAPVVYLRRILAKQTITVGATTIFMYRLVVKGTCPQIFGSIGPDRRRWKDGVEVNEFSRLHPDKLYHSEHTTLFEMEDGSIIFAGIEIDLPSIGVFNINDAFVCQPIFQFQFAVPQ